MFTAAPNSQPALTTATRSSPAWVGVVVHRFIVAGPHDVPVPGGFAPPGFEFYISADIDMNCLREKTIGLNTDVIMNRDPELYEVMTRSV